MVYKPEFEKDAGQRQPPDDSEERPAPSAAQVDEQERCVGSRDEQINRRMIENFEGALQARGRDAVVKRRSGIKAHQGGPVNGATYNVPGAAMRDCQNQQDDETGEAQNQTDAVGDGVAQFFSGITQYARARHA